MAAESKSLIPQIASDGRLLSARTGGLGRSLAVDFARSLEVGLVFALIMIAAWTPQGRANTISSLLAALFTVGFTVRSRYSVRKLGLNQPGSGVLVMLVSGAFMVATIVVVGSVMHRLGPAQPVPWRRAWQYAIWALQQEFILQSFFYMRLESLLGSRRAAVGAALLFSAARTSALIFTWPRAAIPCASSWRPSTFSMKTAPSSSLSVSTTTKRR